MQAKVNVSDPRKINASVNLSASQGTVDANASSLPASGFQRGDADRLRGSRVPFRGVLLALDCLWFSPWLGQTANTCGSHVG